MHCLVRVRQRGLASACIDGLSQATAPYVAVMDADLQHDEAILPRMLDAVHSGGADIAVGSRYAPGGGTAEWNAVRRLESQLATWMCRLVISCEMADPLSGFFLMRREVFEATAPRLSGRGFKILLDILAAADGTPSVAEVPYDFRPRVSGESKLDTRVAWEFLELLLERTLGRWIDVRFMLFTAVGGSGVLVHLAVLGLLHQGLGATFAVAQAAAVVVAMTSNFVLNNLITYRDRRLVGWAAVKGLFSFYAACALGAVINYALAVFVAGLSAHWAVAGFSGAVAGAVWNFATTAAVTWRNR